MAKFTASIELKEDEKGNLFSRQTSYIDGKMTKKGKWIKVKSYKGKKIEMAGNLFKR
jgi:hypothetical protein